MFIDANSLKQHVIAPTLKYLKEINSATDKLLIGTAAVETGLTPLSAYGENDPSAGIGLYNISQQRHLDIWDNYLAFDPNLASLIRGLASQRTFLTNPHEELNTNLAYATSIAWCIYKRSNLTLNGDNTQYLASCWHRYYRSQESDSNQNDFCEQYNSLVLGSALPMKNPTIRTTKAA